jgi:predicted component of viral defense system (DUF524 family)
MNDPEQSEQNDWRHLLTSSERASMLGDIARVTLAVGAQIFPERPWSDLDISTGSLMADKSPVERLAFIEHALPYLTQAAQQIARFSLTTAVPHTRVVTPPIRARRVHTSALLNAVRRGPSVRSLEESITVLSFDTPENRAVHSFLWRLQRDSAAIEQIAEAEGETQAADRAVQCVRSLRGLLALPCWEEISSGSVDWTRPPTARAAMRPEYASVFDTMAHYRRGFQFDWTHPTLTLPARETWRLYEIWCLFMTMEALCDLGCVPTASGLFLIKEGRLTWTLATDTASRLTLRTADNRRLSLIYNPTFAEGRHSLSHTMQPDIVLTDGNHLWILDAKFKAYALPGDEGSDINQMHAYRDAIIDDSGRRTVATAWCLYAGLADAPNRPRLTYGRAGDAAVGALCLRPSDGATLTNLRDLLSDWLRDA